MESQKDKAVGRFAKNYGAMSDKQKRNFEGTRTQYLAQRYGVVNSEKGSSANIQAQADKSSARDYGKESAAALSDRLGQETGAPEEARVTRGKAAAKTGYR